MNSLLLPLNYSIIANKACILKNLIPLILLIKDGKFVSGQKLAEELNVSRATISSWMADLSSFGLDISKITGKGYRLSQPIELLDRSLFLEQLDPFALSKLKVVDILAESDSTNKNALTSEYQLNEWKLIATEFQHAGRGRRGREWISPFGANLLFSLGHKTLWKPETLYLASIISGLAVVDVLRDLLGTNVRLKWPNDVYIGDRKVSGILCELLGSPQDEALLVVGVGLNVYFNPEATDIPSTKLIDHLHHKINKTTLLAKLTSAIIGKLTKANIEGVDDLQAQWQHVDYLKNKHVVVSQGAKTYSGIARGIDNSGQLMLDIEGGDLKTFNGGEVSVRW